MTDIVSVSVTRSGGVTGMGSTHSVKVADLPAERATALCNLAESVNATPEIDPAEQSERDAFRYKFHIERESGSMEFAVLETQLTPEQRSLVEMVNS